jgi:hypothetical protein
VILILVSLIIMLLPWILISSMRRSGGLIHLWWRNCSYQSWIVRWWWVCSDGCGCVFRASHKWNASRYRSQVTRRQPNLHFCLSVM